MIYFLIIVSVEIWPNQKNKKKIEKKNQIPLIYDK